MYFRGGISGSVEAGGEKLSRGIVNENCEM